MNKTLKSLAGIVLLATTTTLCTSLYAQDDVIAPYANENEVTSKLFNLNELEINYHFSADAGNSNQVIVEFSKLSHWSNKEDMSFVTAIAEKYYSKTQDSFKSATSAKRLDIHIPAANEPVTVKILEYPVRENMLVFKGNMQSPLKVNMDTIRVVKTNSETKTKIQYTFLLKDIDQIKDLNGDQQMIRAISCKFDSIVNAYRHEWTNEDRWTHNLTVSYYPGNEEKRQLSIKTIKTDNEKGKFYRAVDIDVQIGASLFRNEPSPMLQTGFSFKWPVKNSEYMFLRLSVNGLLDIVWQDKDFKAYSLSFTNLEVGWIKNKTQTKIPLYRTAFGIGYANNIKDNKVYDPTLALDVYNIYYSFSLSKTFTIIFNQYIGARSFYGITGLIRLY